MDAVNDWAELRRTADAGARARAEAPARAAVVPST